MRSACCSWLPPLGMQTCLRGRMSCTDIYIGSAGFGCVQNQDGGTDEV